MCVFTCYHMNFPLIHWLLQQFAHWRLQQHHMQTATLLLSFRFTLCRVSAHNSPQRVFSSVSWVSGTLRQVWAQRSGRVTEYFYSRFEVLYLSISVFCYLILLLHLILKAKTLLATIKGAICKNFDENTFKNWTLRMNRVKSYSQLNHLSNPLL